MLIYNKLTGMVKEAEERVYWTITVYGRDCTIEDMESLDDMSTLVYNSYEEMIKDQKTENYKTQLKSWEKLGLQIVIKPVRMVVIGE